MLDNFELDPSDPATAGFMTGVFATTALFITVKGCFNLYNRNRGNNQVDGEYIARMERQLAEKKRSKHGRTPTG